MLVRLIVILAVCAPLTGCLTPTSTPKYTQQKAEVLVDIYDKT